MSGEQLLTVCKLNVYVKLGAYRCRLLNQDIRTLLELFYSKKLNQINNQNYY